MAGKLKKECCSTEGHRDAETAPDQRGQRGQNHQPDAWLRCCGDDGRTGKEYNGVFYIIMYETLC